MTLATENDSTPAADNTVRLQKYMADCGIDSRRHCETHIEQGRVTVNGRTVTQPGTKIDPRTDRVGFNGEPVIKHELQQSLTVMLNKPAGYIVTAQDTHGRQTVYELLSNIPVRIFPIGRLDMDSEGLLLLTNDGQLAQKLAHPSHEVEKEYIVTAWGEVPREAIEALREGVELEDGYRTKPCEVRTLSAQEHNTTRLGIIITEGRKRQIRMMLRAVGHAVKSLIRIREGNIKLDKLPVGKYRVLTPGEVKRLMH